MNNHKVFFIIFICTFISFISVFGLSILFCQFLYASELITPRLVEWELASAIQFFSFLFLSPTNSFYSTIVIIIFFYYLFKLQCFALFKLRALKDIFLFPSHEQKVSHFNNYYKSPFYIYLYIVAFFINIFSRCTPNVYYLDLLHRRNEYRTDKRNLLYLDDYNIIDPFTFHEHFSPEILVCYSFLQKFIPVLFLLIFIFLTIYFYLIFPISYYLCFCIKSNFFRRIKLVYILENFLLFLTRFYFFFSICFCFFAIYIMILVFLKENSDLLGLVFEPFKIYAWFVIYFKHFFLNTFFTWPVDNHAIYREIPHSTPFDWFVFTTFSKYGIFSWMCSVFFMYGAFTMIVIDFILWCGLDEKPNPNNTLLFREWLVKKWNLFLFFCFTIKYLFYLTMTYSYPNIVPALLVIIYQSFF